MVGAVHPEEVGGRHPRFGEYVGADVIAVGHPADVLDQEAQQDVATIAITAPLSRREVGRFIYELGQEVAGLEDRVVGLFLPQIFVTFARFFVGVVAYPRCMGQQVPDGHLFREWCAFQTQALPATGVSKVSLTVDQLQRRDRSKEFGYRCRIEARMQVVGDAPGAAGVAVGARVQPGCASRDERRTGEQILGFLVPEVLVQ